MSELSFSSVKIHLPQMLFGQLCATEFDVTFLNERHALSKLRTGKKCSRHLNFLCAFYIVLFIISS